MNLVGEIQKWAEGLPAWQSDAIRRLFDSHELSANDTEDLIALLKAEHGLVDEKGRKARRFSKADIPEGQSAGESVKLLAIRDLENVNAIAPNQRLSIAADGLTVIYGDNGSGKSGYSRVLKRACRARGSAEPILPDANLPKSKTGTAKAHFEVLNGGKEETVSWSANDETLPALAGVAIFDSKCARAYLDEENDFAYVPFGLDILQSLASVMTQMKGILDKELAYVEGNAIALPELVADTQAAKLVSGLSAKTKKALVEKLATLDEEEVAQAKTLKEQLSVADPAKQAEQLRTLASRLAKAKSKIDAVYVGIGKPAADKAKDLCHAYETAHSAAELATQQFQEDKTLLPGTGTEAWKKLFEAARAYSQLAYPKVSFPNFAPDQRCLFCQQPLRDSTKQLERFEIFVQGKLAKEEAEAKAQLGAAIDNLKALSDDVGIDENLAKELSGQSMSLSKDVSVLPSKIGPRLAKLRAVLKVGKWEDLPEIPTSPSPQLGKIIDELLLEVQELESVADPEARSKVQAEYNELLARLQLRDAKTQIFQEIERLQLRDSLKLCVSGLRTNAVSKKATDIAEAVVSKNLEEALNREFDRLGVEHLKVELQSRTQKGKSLHKLCLNLPLAASLESVLSEGEQRAIAIASFLAEVSLANDPTGIVFDDPVSSLDHKRRERVSRRLAEEAKYRQVVVFTHDLYFMNLLVTEAKRVGANCEPRSLEQGPDGYGVPHDDIPFEGKNTKARIGQLRAMQQQIAKAFREKEIVLYKAMTTEAYRQLRLAWERAVEEVLFRNVVLRFRKSVETTRLSKVVVEAGDHETVDKWMTLCSNYAHDQALLGGTELPKPQELLDHINALDDWRKELESRAEQLVKQQTVPKTAVKKDSHRTSEPDT